MILLNKRITATVRARRSDIKDLIRGIRNNKGHQIDIGHNTPLIDDLEIRFFKDKGIKEGVGITDLISRIVQILK